MVSNLSGSGVVCSMCGMSYGRRKGNFLINYGSLYKGTGYLSVCKECVDAMYNKYFSQCGDSRAAVRQTCRKLDLYWSDSIFDSAEKVSTNRSVITTYLTKINKPAYADKSYDDTMAADGTMWTFGQIVTKDESKEENDSVDDSIKTFWGPGYTSDMYNELEQRRMFWMSKFPDGYDIDIGTEAIIRQICSLEIDINRDRMAGKPIDKSVNALNTLLGSASLKPTQKKEDIGADAEKTPFGVWIDRWETKRPIPDVDPSMRDVDGIIKYISTWFYGHAGKMLGVKNIYSKMYEEEIAKLRVKHPEYAEEEDDEFLFDIFSDGGSTDGNASG